MAGMSRECTAPARLPWLAAVLAMLVLVATGCSGDTGSSTTATPSPRASATLGNLRITGVFVRSALQGEDSAAYLSVTNAGDKDDALVAISVDAAGMAGLHQSVASGAAERMEPVDRLPVPAHSTVELKPGGYHAMLMDLTRTLRTGDTVTLTLTFERAGTVTVQAPVVPYTDAGV
jgi:copper(I)-binding protein